MNRPISINHIKMIANDIIADVEGVNDSHSEARYYGIVDGLNNLIRRLEEASDEH